jgi:hypothetical protein
MTSVLSSPYSRLSRPPRDWTWVLRSWWRFLPGVRAAAPHRAHVNGTLPPFVEFVDPRASPPRPTSTRRSRRRPAAASSSQGVHRGLSRCTPSPPMPLVLPDPHQHRQARRRADGETALPVADLQLGRELSPEASTPGGPAPVIDRLTRRSGRVVDGRDEYAAGGEHPRGADHRALATAHRFSLGSCGLSC